MRIPLHARYVHKLNRLIDKPLEIGSYRFQVIREGDALGYRKLNIDRVNALSRAINQRVLIRPFIYKEHLYIHMLLISRLLNIAPGEIIYKSFAVHIDESMIHESILTLTILNQNDFTGEFNRASKWARLESTPFKQKYNGVDNRYLCRANIKQFKCRRHSPLYPDRFQYKVVGDKFLLSW